jgi:hypothetical protein
MPGTAMTLHRHASHPHGGGDLGATVRRAEPSPLWGGSERSGGEGFFRDEDAKTSPQLYFKEAEQLYSIFGPAMKLASSSPSRGEGGPKDRMRGARSAMCVPGSPLIASHALGTSPRREKRVPATILAIPSVEVAHVR